MKKLKEKVKPVEWVDVLEIIIKWFVPVAFGWLLAYITLRKKKNKALENGMQCLLRSEIIKQHEKWTERNYCPIYAKEALTRAYKAYHELEGNDVATELYKDTMRLPEEPPKE